MDRFDSPVALIVFNRPETTRRVFAAIAKARPSRLLIIADGPRSDRPGESERCAEVKQIVSKVDWPCKVDTNFASENIGCRPRVISGLNWVFSLVEEAIILEDDCLPDPSFFPYCSELLDRYRNHCQIGFISGFNSLEKSFPFPYSYYFTQMTFTWGWATWRRSWQQYDESMRSWPEVKKANLLENVFPDKKVLAYWYRIFDRMHQGTGQSIWDYQWTYASWTRNWLNILPARNLIQNIGFGEGATHTKGFDPDFMIPASPLDLPLRHPPAITAWPAHVMQAQRSVFVLSLGQRIRRKLKLMFRSRTRRNE